ncbi:MAG: phosphoribosylformylglycinamidine synthase subunit PurS [Nitrospiraceae bacterium]|nr:phosphoribosylformylglycinamidine synthase subunit PurS [Nitrospiraceae bacterium]
MKARVFIRLRQGVLDPQGKAVLSGLTSMGFGGLEDVRVGKLIEITFEAGKGRETAASEVAQMCEKLLANTVIEDYSFEMEE